MRPMNRGLGSPTGQGTFGSHTWTYPGLLTNRYTQRVNVTRKATSAMRPLAAVNLATCLILEIGV